MRHRITPGLDRGLRPANPRQQQQRVGIDINAGSLDLANGAAQAGARRNPEINGCRLQRQGLLRPPPAVAGDSDKRDAKQDEKLDNGAHGNSQAASRSCSSETSINQRAI